MTITAGFHLRSPLTPTRRPNAPTGERRGAAANCHVTSASAKTPFISLSSHQNPNPLNFASVSVSASASFSAASGLLHRLSPNSSAGAFSGGGKGGGGGGFPGGGGEESFWSGFFSNCLWPFITPSALAKEEDKDDPSWDPHGLPANLTVQLNKLSGFKKYRISDVSLYDKRRRDDVAKDDSFGDMVSLRSGEVYTKQQLEREVKTLAKSGMFDKVEIEAKTKPDGTLGVKIPFVESFWNSADRFRCINVGMTPQTKPVAMDPDMTENEKMRYFRKQEREYKTKMEASRPCLLPTSVHREIVQMIRENGKVSARLLHKIRDKVQKWYVDQGYVCASVVNFANLHTKEVVCEVAEGDITKLDIQFNDKLGNMCEGNTKLALLSREIPKVLRQGQVFNIEAAKQALKNINSLGLFSNIEVNPRPDEKTEGGIVMELKLKELEQKSAEVSTEWSFIPGRGGRPTLASIQPGGTVSFENRNIQGLNRSLVGSLTTTNFLNPQDDLAFKFEYVHPYLDGVHNSRNRTLRTTFFNSRKLSPVFTGGSGEAEVPSISVDRVGLKANITENFNRQSNFTYGLVMEEITTRDESSNISTNGQRVLPNGGISADGPPTTLSGTGIDRVVFAQANITRDNTKFVNGAIVGDRNVFQFDQGIGVGSKFPFFNRHQLSLTRFIQLKKVEEGAGKPQPPVLVLHGNYGGCVGDLPSYDAFTLGGPYSVRGYNMGEIGAARNKLELAAELRVPVKNTHVYAFAEHGNDLGSSKDVKGNPTEVYKRVGHGSSYGVGLKLGPVRAEYAVDHNSGTGSVFFRFGERF